MRRLISLGIAALSTVAFVAAAMPSASALPDSSVISAYSLAAPRSVSASGIVTRAIVPVGADCPSISVTGAGGRTWAVRTQVRPRPERTDPAFEPLTVCSANMPIGALTASIQGREIPAHMPQQVDQLAMFGDSGCRITGAQLQDCSDPDAWPLAKISASIAAEAPDAIIFNGDFFYREAPCQQANQPWCGGSPPPVAGMPFTDTAYSWLADVFMPMAPLLASAPLIVTRGNHEACYRGGNGYFLYFDPRPDTWNTCAPILVDGVLTAAPTVPTPTHVIDLNVRPGRTLRLAIVDSAGGNDAVVDAFAEIQRPTYQRAADLTPRKAGRESWLLTHRPIYGFFSSEFAIPGQPLNPWLSADQAAAAYGLLGTYDLVFSSHVHLAEVVQLPGLPPQLILGNGGTLLDPPTGYPLPATGAPAGPGQTYPAPTSAWVEVKFGYVMATPGDKDGVWRMDMRDPDGQDFARCGLRAGQMYCRTLAGD
jgi:hypothetical protein